MKLLNNMKKLILSFIIIGLFACSSSESEQNGKSDLAHQNQSQPIKEFVFGDDIPFPESHASTLVNIDSGQFLISWFGGTKEKNDDVSIWVSKGTPGNWGKPYEIAKIRDNAHWNPVLHKSKEGRVYLYFKVGKEISHWETWVKTSDDQGQTWSEAVELVEGDRGGRGPVRNKLIELSNGVWVAGASNELGRWNVFMDRSEDGGKTWSATPYLSFDTSEITGKGIIQPTLWESSPGNVHALLRSTSGMICRTDSKDYGKTWSSVYKTSLPNPNSGIDLVKLEDGTLVLIYNPDNTNWGSRNTISATLSFDNGLTWPKKVDIESGVKNDEFSYPAIINNGDTVSLTYTWNRKKIVFWQATKDWIINNSTKL